MRKKLTILGMLMLMAGAGGSAYTYGYLRGLGFRNTTLCQDALARRLQVEEVLTAPLHSDAATLAVWQAHLPEIRAQQARADTDRQRYC